MPLRQFSNRKRYVLPLTIFVYAVTLVILLIWIERLKPNEPTEITQISFNKDERTLNITGENLPSNFSALLTPNMQRQQDTISSRYTWGKVFNATGAKNHLWIANGTNGILSYNVLNPKNPVLEGALALKKDFRAWNITTHNDIALVAGGSSGLAGIDISSTESPELKFTIYENKIIFDSIIKDGTAIILTSEEGLLLLDINDMNAPTEIGKIILNGGLKRITQSGDKAFVVGGKNKKGQLYILDISQPRQATIIANIELPHTVYHVNEIAGTLFISMGSHGLYIANTSTINQTPPPHRIEEISAFGLCTYEQDVFISNGAHHIHHYRIDNGALTLIKTFATVGKCQKIFSFNNYIVACLGKKGFALFDPSKENITTAATLYFNKTYGNSPNIMQKNGHVIIHSQKTINLFTTMPEGSISQYDSITFTSIINDITMDHKYAYIALRNKEIHIIALQPKATQRTKKVITWFKNAQDITINGSNLYLGIKKLGIFVLNLNQLTEPSNTTPNIAIAYSHYDIKDGLLYLATRPNGLKIYQIGDDAKPSLIGELQYPSAIKESSYSMDVAVKDGFAFMTNGDRGLLSIDVRDPEKPIIGDALSLNGVCSRLILQGDYAYITNDRHKITVVDINDPLKIKILCDLPTTRAIAFGENKMYQLNDIGVYINSPPRPLRSIKISAQLIKFKLPFETTAGYYDLQLATTQDITKHSDLLHYSQQHGWSMTRVPEIR